jgi:transcriptional regulator with XRE-family HTH domain
MVPHVATPTRAKKRLGQFLRALREEAGVSPEDAGREVKTSESTINRYEVGDVKLVWATVRVLLSRYGASPEQVAEAERLFDLVKEEPRSVRLPTGTHSTFRKLINAEREAVLERVLAPYVMPALLQHERYARALIASDYHLKRAKAPLPDKVINARLHRQEPLEGPDPLKLHALLDEAVLHREIGGPDVLREQLAHLLVAAARPNITLQVVPFTAGSYGSMNGSVTIVDYPEPDSTPGVYLEYPAGGAWVDNQDDVDRFTTMFDDVIELALEPDDTTNLIHDQIRALNGQ